MFMVFMKSGSFFFKFPRHHRTQFYILHTMLYTSSFFLIKIKSYWTDIPNYVRKRSIYWYHIMQCIQKRHIFIWNQVNVYEWRNTSTCAMDRCFNELAPLKSDQALWFNIKQTLFSSHRM